MTQIRVTREALVQAGAWPELIAHALQHGDVRPGWLASVPDLPALAVGPWGAQLAALEGLDPKPLVALGHDLGRVRAVAEAFAALGRTGSDLSIVRLRALCHPTG